MNDHYLLLVFILAVGLDLLCGDPDYAWHPVRLIGKLSQSLERFQFYYHWIGYLAGLLHVISMLAICLGCWFVGHVLLNNLSSGLALPWDVFICFSLLCNRGLVDQGKQVYKNLQDLDKARLAVSQLVSRNPQSLDQAGVIRATIESQGENLTDAVIMPTFALALFGIPGLIAVKVISTLDSMIGYQHGHYQHFGTVAAHTDDVLNWLPARFSVCIVWFAARLCGLHTKDVFPCARTYHSFYASPNSGWGEAAFAGALNTRLSGPTYYGNQLLERPFIGNPDWTNKPQPEILQQALALNTTCCYLTILLALLCLMALH